MQLLEFLFPLVFPPLSLSLSRFVFSQFRGSHFNFVLSPYGFSCNSSRINKMYIVITIMIIMSQPLLCTCNGIKLNNNVTRKRKNGREIRMYTFAFDFCFAVCWALDDGSVHCFCFIFLFFYFLFFRCSFVLFCTNLTNDKSP